MRVASAVPTASASPQVQETPDIVEAVECPSVHIGPIRLGTCRRRADQRDGLIAELSEQAP